MQCTEGGKSRRAAFTANDKGWSPDFKKLSEAPRCDEEKTGVAVR